MAHLHKSLLKINTKIIASYKNITTILELRPPTLSSHVYFSINLVNAIICGSKKMEIRDCVRGKHLENAKNKTKQNKEKCCQLKRRLESVR